MAQPTPYNPQTNFDNDEAGNVSGRSTVRTTMLDAELAAIALTASQIIGNLTAIQRDDNALLDGIVTIASMSSAVQAYLTAAGGQIRGTWVTLTVYAVKDVVVNGTGTYICGVAHTAGASFAVDKAAGKWVTLFDSSAFSASAVAFTPTGGVSATTVQAAIAEVDSEKLAKAANLSDVQDVSIARGNLAVQSIAQGQSAIAISAINAGTADALVGVFTPAVAALTNNMLLIVECAAPNTSTVPTFTPNAVLPITAKPIVKYAGVPLVPSDIAGANFKALLCYDASLDSWVLINPSIPAALSILPPPGNGRLAKSGANLVFSPFNGNSIQISGTICTIPDAGVSLAPTGLQPLFATTTRSIAANVATIGHAALTAAIPVGALIAVRDVGGASAYNGLKTVTASTTVSTSYAAVAANEGSTADTNGRVLPIYYIYALGTAGAVSSLEASFTGHSTSTTAGNKGVQIKTGDDTRSLVGMGALIAGPAWVDTSAQRFVLSWFNRQSIATLGNFTADRTTGSGSAVELNTEIRNEFLTWAGAPVESKFAGGMTQSSSVGAILSVGYDGLTMQDGACYSFLASIVTASGFAQVQALAEGYHYSTILGIAVGGTQNCTAKFIANSAGQRFVLSTTVQG